MLRGIRGATTISDDTAEQIAAATQELLGEIVARNGLDLAAVAAVTFSVTPDVRAAFPAAAARAIGWRDVPMECYQQMDVPGALAHCIRVLVLWNSERRAEDVVHVYLRDAVRLRPDLVNAGR